MRFCELLSNIFAAPLLHGLQGNSIFTAAPFRMTSHQTYITDILNKKLEQYIDRGVPMHTDAHRSTLSRTCILYTICLFSVCLERFDHTGEFGTSVLGIFLAVFVLQCLQYTYWVYVLKQWQACCSA